VVSGLNNPVDLQTPDDGTGRFFVVEQAGTIRILSGNNLLPGNFLDIRSKVTSGDELGLLGVAFHPNFSSDKRFFVNYTRTVGGQRQTVIAEYKVSLSDPNLADAGSERILLVIDQPFDNHKAGQLAFKTNDGLLFFGLGDGGGGGDPNGNGQNTMALLGKMLRIDVDSAPSPGLPYKIPPDNPFAGGGGQAEIYAIGFRNPWRFSFEPGTGRMFVADVGQNNFEEIDLVTKGGNFGWNKMEGKHCYPDPMASCNMNGFILPIAEYDHTEGEAIIGGYIYKGSQISGLVDSYVFADLNGKMWYLKESPPGTWTRNQLLSTGRAISSFGRDAAGEIYVVDLGGSILKIVPQ
jgi:glucose/arabinose dehydrogenase